MRVARILDPTHPETGIVWFVSNIDDAAELKDVAEGLGLRVSDKRSHPTASRFVIALDHGTDADRLLVHASPNKIWITLDLTDGTSDPLTHEQALQKMREAINE
jgi:hypothetical protein